MGDFGTLVGSPTTSINYLIQNASKIILNSLNPENQFEPLVLTQNQTVAQTRDGQPYPGNVSLETGLYNATFQMANGDFVIRTFEAVKKSEYDVINDYLLEANLSPNPTASTSILLNMLSNREMQVNVSVKNLIGTIENVYAFLINSASSNTFQISLPSSLPGIYLIDITLPNGVVLHKQVTKF